jgi:hypothetical protein
VKYKDDKKKIDSLQMKLGHTKKSLPSIAAWNRSNGKSRGKGQINKIS